MGVHGDLILSGIADQTLVIGEGDIGRRGSVALVVGDDLNTIVLPDTHTSKKQKKKSSQGRNQRQKPEMRHTSMLCQDQYR
jgi:hypothetical protein